MGVMKQPRQHVLMVGLGSDAVASLGPALPQEAFAVHTVEPSAHVFDLVRETQFELLIVGLPMGSFDIQDLIQAARDPSSVCLRSGLVVVSTQEHLDEAMALLDHGVNRVVSLDWPRSRIWQAIADLLAVAPRIRLTAPIRLNLPRELARDSIVLTTSNISISGALLTGFRPLPMGTRFHFILEIPGERLAIRGSAEVVRRTSEQREGVDGVGVRYLDLPRDMRQHLAEVIDSRLPNSRLDSPFEAN